MKIDLTKFTKKTGLVLACKKCSGKRPRPSGSYGGGSTGGGSTGGGSTGGSGGYGGSGSTGGSGGVQKH